MGESRRGLVDVGCGVIDLLSVKIPFSIETGFRSTDGVRCLVGLGLSRGSDTCPIFGVEGVSLYGPLLRLNILREGGRNEGG